MYGVRNTSDFNFARFQLFSTTYRCKQIDDNFQQRFQNFDSQAYLHLEHLFRVCYVTKLWNT